MKIAIVGSRDYDDQGEIDRCVWSLPPDTEVVSGAGGIVDKTAEDSARERGLNVTIFPADWKRYGKAAGAVRNREIAKYADRVIAFWDGSSKGTKITIDIFRSLGKPVEIRQYGKIIEPAPDAQP